MILDEVLDWSIAIGARWKRFWHSRSDFARLATVQTAQGLRQPNGI
jgi:hypothetical protein